MTTVLGYGFILMAGGVTAALMLVTAGRASVRSGVFPGWLGRALALLVLWVLIAAIVMIRRGPVARSGSVATESAYRDTRARSIA